MAVLAKFEQSPNERLRYSIDYENWLDTTEVISTMDFVITPTSAPPFVVDGYVIVDDKKVVFYTSGGVDNTDYKVEVFANTSDSQTREDIITYRVRDP